MWEYRLVRYAVYGTSFVLFSEVLYHGFQLLSKLLTAYKRYRNGEPADDNDEIADVVWTNELTQSCANQHHQEFKKEANRHSPGSTPPPHGSGEPTKMHENGRFNRLPAANSKRTCSNPYCAGNSMGRLTQFFDKAQHSIDIAIYTFTSHDLAQSLLRAVRRGVVIRIISDTEMVYSTGSQIIALTKAGCPVRCPKSTMLMHHKFCIIDGAMRVDDLLKKAEKPQSNDKKKYQGILMSGSTNWTMQGFGGNWENILVTSNSKLIEKFELEFRRMWKAFDVKTGPMITTTSATTTTTTSSK